jgi:hypothetical protein
MSVRPNRPIPESGRSHVHVAGMELHALDERGAPKVCIPRECLRTDTGFLYCAVRRCTGQQFLFFHYRWIFPHPPHATPAHKEMDNARVQANQIDDSAGLAPAAG